MINPEDIQWEISGVEGTFEGNVLKPTSYGTGTVTATVAGIKAEYPVYVFGGPVKLTLSHTNITLISKERKTFTVIGEHSEGYKASIDPADITGRPWVASVSSPEIHLYLPNRVMATSRHRWGMLPQTAQ